MIRSMFADHFRRRCAAVGVVVVRVSALPRYSSHRSCFVSWTCIESTVPNGRSAGVQSSVTMTMTSVGRVCCRREHRDWGGALGARWRNPPVRPCLFLSLGPLATRREMRHDNDDEGTEEVETSFRSEADPRTGECR